MKTILNLSVLVLLIMAAPGRCLAMMGIEEVTKARAKELGLEIKWNAAGPDAVRVVLEFEIKGELQSYSRVDLEMHDGGKLVLFSSLREEGSTPGHIVVSFAVDRGQLDKVMLRVVSGVPTDMVGHDLRMKDFVDLNAKVGQAPSK